MRAVPPFRSTIELTRLCGNNRIWMTKHAAISAADPASVSQIEGRCHSCRSHWQSGGVSGKAKGALHLGHDVRPVPPLDEGGNLC